ncbi:MAG: hypothetical protein AABY22_30070 [Nanoarchaeota archaeon]
MKIGNKTYFSSNRYYTSVNNGKFKNYFIINKNCLPDTHHRKIGPALSLYGSYDVWILQGNENRPNGPSCIYDVSTQLDKQWSTKSYVSEEVYWNY